MWQPYIDIAKTYFKNATIIIDKFHYIRQTMWAVEGVRKRIQKKMSKKYRKYFKKSKKLILTRYHYLDDESKSAVHIMLSYNEDLRVAHILKENY